MESALWGIGFLPCSMLDLLLWDVSHHATKTLKNRSGEPQMRRYQAFLPVWLYASASTKLAALWPMLTGPKLHPASDAGEATPSCGVIKTHKLPIQTPPNPRTLEWCDAMHVNFPSRNVLFVCLFWWVPSWPFSMALRIEAGQSFVHARQALCQPKVLGFEIIWTSIETHEKD